MARKILLADDSVTAQNMGRKILVDAGYDVLTVNNGSAALKRITEAKPDLIILDVYMPGYSGLEVCQRLKDAPETANIPVLLSVGKLEPFKPQEARRVKANAHIVKPFEASELLSAVARLEDYIVPQAHKPAFCSPLPNVDSFEEEGFAKSERSAGSGRKSGGRGSSKKKESEAESEDAVANFRDFRKAKGKSADGGTSSGESSAMGTAPSAAQNDAAVPEMPRDITKEELDALSALAARLDGAGAESASSPAEVSPAPTEPAQVSAQSTGTTLGDAASASDSEKAKEATNVSGAEVPVTETPKEREMPVAEAAGSAVVALNEIPVAKVEPVSEVAAAEQSVVAPAPVVFQAVESQPAERQTVEPELVAPQPVEQKPAEFKAAEFQVVTAEPVNTGLFVQEAAPVDRQDEPMFGSAVAEEKMSPEVETQESPVPVQAEAENDRAEEEKFAEKKFAVEKSEPVEAGPAVPVVAKVQETVETEAPAPTDEELAEALRLLTPATGYAEVTRDGTPPSDGAAALVSAQSAGANLGYPSGEEAGSEASARRWMAEAVGLSPEESAVSLEEEMFRTFATAPAKEIEAAPAANQVSMIAAAVENRLAEAAQPAAATAEEVPKAMAAAAAAENSAPVENSTTGSEEIAIASIVDKVLADLRPKIVEEIAKKLGKNG